MLVFKERGAGKTGVPGEIRLEAKERTNKKLKPYMASTLGLESGPHWWEASALTTAPSLNPPPPHSVDKRLLSGLHMNCSMMW